MRMDPEAGESAAQWLARAGEREIADVLWTYGEERSAPAHRARHRRPPRGAPLDAHRAAGRADRLGDAARREAGSIRPPAASRRSASINRELADLEAGLDAALARLKPGGRLAVISFHSLEDRIVKRFIARARQGAAGNRRRRRRMPSCRACAPSAARKAAPAELAANPRARSAVLRVAERLPGAEDPP
jgi:16S rRNA (cytosine1402-N4)-methyltransferase